MNETLRSILMLALGVLAPLRRWRLNDARQKQRLASLRQIREWIEAYRSLFRFKYPDWEEIAYIHYPYRLRRIIDEIAYPPIFEELKQYRETLKNYEQAEEKGVEAIDKLEGKKNWRRDRLLFAIERYILFQPTKEVFGIGGSRILTYPRDFLKAIAPYLDELACLRTDLFDAFPNHFDYSISWDMLDHINPNEVANFIQTRFGYLRSCSPEELSQDRDDMEKELRECRSYRSNAEKAIENALREIGKYEEKWIVPDS